MGEIISLALIAGIVMGIQLGIRYFRSWRLRRRFQAGMSAYKEKRFPEALSAFQKCVRIAPEWLYVRTLAGICLSHIGREADALREIELVEALQPREAETWTLISTFFMLCMPENEPRLFDALERLAALDATAARTLIGQPLFSRYGASPRLHALRQQLAPSE